MENEGKSTLANMDDKTAIAVMARDIHYMKESMGRLEKAIIEQGKNYITQKDFENWRREHDRDVQEYKNGQEDTNKDIEARMRVNEKAITKILTWGSVGVLALGIIEFLIGKFL